MYAVFVNELNEIPIGPLRLDEMKWNESGFRPPLCTYRLNWARRTSWGWWDDWDDTVLQTQDSKFESWRSEAEHATSRSRRLPTILTFTRGWGRNNFVSFKPPRPGTEPRTLAWKAAVLTTTLGPPPSTGRRRVSQCQTPARSILIHQIHYPATSVSYLTVLVWPWAGGRPAVVAVISSISSAAPAFRQRCAGAAC